MRKRLSFTIAAFALAVFAGLALAQNVSNYKEQGGARWVIGGSLDVAPGGDLDVESGATLKIAGTAVTSTAAELNKLDGASATTAQIDSIDGGAAFDTVILCGDGPSGAGTVYLGPDTASYGGDGGDASIGGTVCNALDNATEATADAPILTNVAFKVAGAVCTTDGTIGAAENVVFTMRSAEADTSPAQTCTIGVGEKDCSITNATTTDVAAGATIAMKAVQTGDNTTDNYWCRATIIYQ